MKEKSPVVVSVLIAVSFSVTSRPIRRESNQPGVELSTNWPPKLRNWIWDTEMVFVTALYDACTLYPAPLRDLFMQLAHQGLVNARWSNRIHEEWGQADGVKRRF